MQTVSASWDKASRQTLLPEMMVELTYSVTDPNILKETDNLAVWDILEQPSGGLQLPEVDYRYLLETKHGDPKTPSLLKNAWGLDGTFGYDEDSNEGYVNGLSNEEDCAFLEETPPGLSIEFDALQEGILPGLSITWSEALNEWAASFRVTAYRGDIIIASTTVYDNTSVVSNVSIDMSGFDKIELQILEWCLPDRRARCNFLYLGNRLVFTKDDLLGYTHSQSVDLLSATLPKNSITFRLRNENGQWNPDNPQGVGRYLMEQQKIEVQYGMKLPGGTEWIPGGVFWLSDWNIPNNGLEVTLTASSAVSFLNKPYVHPTDGNSYSFYDVGCEIWENAPKPSYQIPLVTIVLPEDYPFDYNGNGTMAEVLQLMAHASNCIIYQDRTGNLFVWPRQDEWKPWGQSQLTYVIDENISYSYPEYQLGKPLKEVSVGYGNNLRVVIPYNATGETQTIDNPLITTQEMATLVGENAIDVLRHRKVVTGEFRADLRLDPMDSIIVTSKYGSTAIILTDIEYSTTGGSFRGKYTGRVVSTVVQNAPYRVGEIYAGEV